MEANSRKRIEALMREKISLVPYDERWPALYAEVEARLKKLLPRQLVQRISHIGSTAVKGLSGKPVIDVQVEVSDMERVKLEIVPLMESEGYEFIWRPSIGEMGPYYAWFIKRNEAGDRTHHIHMVEPDQASVDRIIFRDHLRHYPEEAAAYEALKKDLAQRHPKDRDAYTQSKTAFVQAVLKKARLEKMRK